MEQNESRIGFQLGPVTLTPGELVFDRTWSNPTQVSLPDPNFNVVNSGSYEFKGELPIQFYTWAKFNIWGQPDLNWSTVAIEVLVYSLTAGGIAIVAIMLAPLIPGIAATIAGIISGASILGKGKVAVYVIFGLVYSLNQFLTDTANISSRSTLTPPTWGSNAQFPITEPSPGIIKPYDNIRAETSSKSPLIGLKAYINTEGSIRIDSLDLNITTPTNNQAFNSGNVPLSANVTGEFRYSVSGGVNAFFVAPDATPDPNYSPTPSSSPTPCVCPSVAPGLSSREDPCTCPASPTPSLIDWTGSDPFLSNRDIYLSETDNYKIKIALSDNGSCKNDGDKIELNIENLAPWNPTTEQPINPPDNQKYSVTRVSVNNQIPNFSDQFTLTESEVVRDIDLPGYQNKVTIKAIEFGSCDDHSTLGIRFLTKSGTQLFRSSIPLSPSNLESNFELNCYKNSSGATQALDNNLKQVGFIVPCSTRTHHIVARTAAGADISRKMLQIAGFAMPPDDWRNGVSLPFSPEAQRRAPFQLHRGNHTGDYYDDINEILALKLAEGFSQDLITSDWYDDAITGDSQKREMVFRIVRDYFGVNQSNTQVINSSLLEQFLSATLRDLASKIASNNLAL